ncbi:hypothetical protein [Paracoccus sp. SSK6]|uniref:hypothetical protein n=1 Tax=Paracoccus sp. SSK6 TaxID=3143131 RepID=UPI00321BE814
MIRLLTVLMIMAGLSVPAAAQETAPAAEGAAATEAASDPAGAEEDDDDDDEEEAGGEAAAVYEAKGKFDYGFSGIMARDNRTDLAPLTLASGQPVAGGEYTLKSGGFYRIAINADGSQELALSGGDFFRAIWINEIVINDIEIRPMGVHSIEFDNAGTATISFVAVTPGRYTLSVPGSSGESQQAVFNIQ